jgi:hypothetical protein
MRCFCVGCESLKISHTLGGHHIGIEQCETQLLCHAFILQEMQLQRTSEVQFLFAKLSPKHGAVLCQSEHITNADT